MPTWHLEQRSQRAALTVHLGRNEGRNRGYGVREGVREDGGWRLRGEGGGEGGWRMYRREKVAVQELSVQAL